MKTSKEVKVSVIIPNYNHAQFLSKRISSITEQTFTNYEIILLDDCSIDNSREILQSYQDDPRVSHIIINTENSGSPFIQWEKGIKLAKGEYIWIAESDDFASPLFLEYTVRAIESHPEACLCYTDSYIVNSQGELLESEIYYEWKEDGKTYIFKSQEYLEQNLICHNSIYNASTVLFRKEGCLNITQAYKKMRYAGDWLFWIEQCRKGSVIEIRKKLSYYRKHLDNTTWKGNENGNVITELIYIKKFLYQNISFDWKKRIIDKALFYRRIKYCQASKERKKEFFKIIDQEIGITFFTYFIGLKLKSCLKHLKKLTTYALKSDNKTQMRQETD